MDRRWTTSFRGNNPEQDPTPITNVQPDPSPEQNTPDNLQKAIGYSKYLESELQSQLITLRDKLDTLTKLVGPGSSSIQVAPGVLIFKDDFNDSQLDSSWVSFSGTGTIAEGSNGLVMTVPPAADADWIVGSQPGPRVTYNLPGPRNYFAYCWIEIDSGTTSGHGGVITRCYGPNLDYYKHLQVKRESGQWQILSTGFNGVSPTGNPPNSNPLNTGKTGLWVGIIYMGDWLDFVYNDSYTIDQDPGISAWREHAVSVGTNFDHMNNQVALSALNYGTFPGGTATFKKFRLYGM